MLKKFIIWANQVSDDLTKRGVTLKIVESEMSDNPSARLDIDTQAAIARITCWESGDYDAEVMSVKTERIIFSSQGSLQRDPNYSDTFAEFFKSLNNQHQR